MGAVASWQTSARKGHRRRAVCRIARRQLPPQCRGSLLLSTPEQCSQQCSPSPRSSLSAVLTCGCLPGRLLPLLQLAQLALPQLLSPRLAWARVFCRHGGCTTLCSSKTLADAAPDLPRRQAPLWTRLPALTTRARPWPRRTQRFFSSSYPLQQLVSCPASLYPRMPLGFVHPHRAHPHARHRRPPRPARGHNPLELHSVVCIGWP
mmetsp:Transcript_26273/g.59594  ORF Transcript_26273/g.59594 Transcript_26273/m.59594 type:complete len:206 (-) Transcript_26273:55-672(-)